MPPDQNNASTLDLLTLSDESVADFDLVAFSGREALSEPFRHVITLRARELPGSLTGWIGKLAEWSVAWQDRAPRLFAGRIFEARLVAAMGELPLVEVVVGPAYRAAGFARGTQLIQDKTALDIFDAITAGIPGLVTDKAASAAKRAYAMRYDETELDFLDRLLAQDGIFYYFTYNQSGGVFRHQMRLADAASGYQDVPGGAGFASDDGDAGERQPSLARTVAATAGTRRYHGLEVNKLDTPFRATATLSRSWSSVHDHGHDELAGGTADAAQASGRGRNFADAADQEAERYSGAGGDTALFAGGRVALDWPGSGGPRKLVMVAVEHHATDGGHFGGGGGYRNTWTAIDASLAFRPPAPSGRRRAYGPVLGVVGGSGADGEVVVDGQSRVPVIVSEAVEKDADKPFDNFVWLPVAQQWASGTHGAQFLPRVGTRVLVDFLYGDPDLPFVAGSFYTPSQAYPFDPASKATQTGWRSVTNKNGAVTQELLFEDKPDGEEIYLYTGRNYRRQVDKDELGTIKHDRTITVEHDHKETVKNDQTVAVEHDQATTVSNNRTLDVTGTDETSVAKTRTVTVTGKNLLESKQEIEIKVGPSSIKLTMSGIEIKAPKIDIQATATLSAKAGVQAQYQAPIVQVNADATLVLKGGIVLIN